MYALICCVLCIGVAVIRTGHSSWTLRTGWALCTWTIRRHPTQPIPTKWTVRGWPTVEGGMVGSQACRNLSLSKWDEDIRRSLTVGTVTPHRRRPLRTSIRTVMPCRTQHRTDTNEQYYTGLQYQSYCIADTALMFPYCLLHRPVQLR